MSSVLRDSWLVVEVHISFGHSQLSRYQVAYMGSIVRPRVTALEKIRDIAHRRSRSRRYHRRIQLE